jgi:sporulation protein YlmC with PRC-barrel domain
MTMNKPMTTKILTIAALVWGAGLSAPMLAFPADPNDPNGMYATTLPATIDFQSASWLRDRGLEDGAGKKIGEVEDFIIDRGSGRIEYALVKTGDVVGLGGRTVVVPYSYLGWAASDKKFTLGATKEQLKTYPKFDKDEWAGLNEKKKSRLREIFTRKNRTDVYGNQLGSATSSSITGEVMSVERWRSGNTEDVIVTVKNKDGTTDRILLGPAWYVTASGAVPSRSDTVTIDYYKLPNVTENGIVARTLKNGERTYEFRGSTGDPAWNNSPYNAYGHTYSEASYRYILASQLKGAKIDARGTRVGKVHDLVVDRASGQIAFLAVDPDQNFLGIGDAKRLVPWQVVTTTAEGKVFLDASKEMILASTKVPSEIGTLNNTAQASAAWTAFQVQMPVFTAPAAVSDYTWPDSAVPNDPDNPMNTPR